MDNLGNGDRLTQTDVIEPVLNAAVLLQEKPSTEQRMIDPVAQRTLPMLFIEGLKDAAKGEKDNLTEVAKPTEASKAIKAIEKGDFQALQKQFSDLAKGDQQNMTQNMPLLINEIRKQTGVEVLFSNAEMTVTAKPKDAETGRKDLISISVDDKGKVSVATHEKGGIEQKDYPSVEEASRMITKEINKGNAAKGLKGEALKDISKPLLNPADVEIDFDFEKKEPGFVSRIGKEVALQRDANTLAKMLTQPELTKDDHQYIRMMIDAHHQDGRLKDFAKAVNDQVKALDKSLEFVMDDKHANIRDVGIVTIALKRDGKVISSDSVYTDNGLKVWHPEYRPRK